MTDDELARLVAAIQCGDMRHVEVSVEGLVAAVWPCEPLLESVLDGLRQSWNLGL